MLLIRALHSYTQSRDIYPQEGHVVERTLLTPYSQLNKISAADTA